MTNDEIKALLEKYGVNVTGFTDNMEYFNVTNPYEWEIISIKEVKEKKQGAV